MDNAKLGNEIYKAIYSNYEYVHITEQMENIYDKQMTLHEKLNEIVAQIHSLETEWNDLYNMRLNLKNILKNQAKAKFAEAEKTTN